MEMETIFTLDDGRTTQYADDISLSDILETDQPSRHREQPVWQVNEGVNAMMVSLTHTPTFNKYMAQGGAYHVPDPTWGAGEIVIIHLLCSWIFQHASYKSLKNKA